MRPVNASLLRPCGRADEIVPSVIVFEHALPWRCLAERFTQRPLTRMPVNLWVIAIETVVARLVVIENVEPAGLLGLGFFLALAAVAAFVVPSGATRNFVGLILKAVTAATVCTAAGIVTTRSLLAA